MKRAIRYSTERPGEFLNRAALGFAISAIGSIVSVAATVWLIVQLSSR